MYWSINFNTQICDLIHDFNKFQLVFKVRTSNCIPVLVYSSSSTSRGGSRGRDSGERETDLALAIVLAIVSFHIWKLKGAEGPTAFVCK